MRSPVLQYLLAYIKIDRKDSTAIYLQITNAIINAIQTKTIKTGDRLPSTRSLSSNLYIHRKTVIAAYDELLAQGWVEIIPQKGTYVTGKRIKNKMIYLGDVKSPNLKSAYPVTDNFILDSPYKIISNDFYFTNGTTDFRLLDLRKINQIFNGLIRKKSTYKILNKDFFTENLKLKIELQNYLFITRGIQTESNHILTFQNEQIAIQCLFDTIIQPSDCIVITEFGHFETNIQLQQSEAYLLTVKTNYEGIDIENLKEIIKMNKIRALYIQPKHIYPTTNTISDKNKLELLDLASENCFAIIEDDRNTDFNYSKNQYVTLKSLDNKGLVIYINSLSNLLANPFDIAYIIAPQNHIQQLLNIRNLWQSRSLYLIEESIAEYIHDGLLLRQVQKLNKIYQKRRDNFSRILGQYLEQNIHYELPNNGLAFWVLFNKQIPFLSIIASCNKMNLHIPNYLCYQNKQITGLRLGFGHMNEVEAEEAIAIMSKAIYNNLYK